MENTTEKQNENDNQKQSQNQDQNKGQGNSSEKIVIVQQPKGVDVNFILLLIIVIGLVGYIVYQKDENKTKLIGKHAIDTRIQQLQIAKERIKDVCFCNYTKSTLENKLIVLTTTLDCEISRESSKKIWKIPWGSAAEKVLFKGNKIQYKVPLDSNKIKVEFNPKTNNIRITIPQVELDYDMVEIQSKPSMIEKEVEGSWLPGGPDVAELDKAIYEEVRESVLDVAERQVHLKNKAKEQAEKVVYDFFYMIMYSFLKENEIGMEVIIP